MRKKQSEEEKKKNSNKDSNHNPLKELLLNRKDSDISRYKKKKNLPKLHPTTEQPLNENKHIAALQLKRKESILNTFSRKQSVGKFNEDEKNSNKKMSSNDEEEKESETSNKDENDNNNTTTTIKGENEKQLSLPNEIVENNTREENKQTEDNLDKSSGKEV